MKSLIKGQAITFLFLCSFIFVKAQSISNSAYNVFGIGTLEQQGLVQYESMGNAAIGSRPHNIVNLKNPAALNAIQGFTQIFDVGVTYSGLRQNANEETFQSSFGGLHDLNYWFRANSRTAFSFGVSKFSDATYDILDSQSGSNAIGRSDSRHIGEGGSSQVYLASAYSLSPNLHFGLKSNFLFGGFQENETVTIFDPSAQLDIVSERSFVTATLEAGIQYQFLVSKFTRLVLGSTFRTGSSVDFDEDVQIISNAGTSIDSLSSDTQSELYLPRKIGVGLGLESRSWMVNIDYEAENWGENVNNEVLEYNNRFVSSFGVQFTRDPFSDKLLNRVAFRAGAGVHSNYLDIDGQSFLGRFYSAGIGIPINRGAASINLAYQHYAHGTLESNLIQENTNTFSINVSIRDVWFRKRAFD